MKIKTSFIILLFLLGATSIIVVGQTNTEKTSYDDLLPPLSEPPGCELILRYIDDVLDRAYLNNSNLIVILRMKNIKSITLARTRLDNLEKYIRFRGFTNFEVALDLDASEVEQFELFVQGERLYSIPIKEKVKLDFSPCVVGPKLKVKFNN